MGDNVTSSVDGSVKPHSKKAPAGRQNKQIKPVRRVAFSEVLPKHRSSSSAASDDDNHNNKIKPCRPRCFLCCAWTCLIVFAVALFFLIVGVLLVSILQSGLPDISVKDLVFTKLEFANSTKQTLLNSKIDVFMKFMNKNEKVELSYKMLTFLLSSEHIQLGNATIGNFSQRPKNSTLVNVSTVVTGAVINKDDAGQLADDLKNSAVVVEVDMSGHIGLSFGIFNLSRVPIFIACNVVQSQLFGNNEAKCNIRMFPLDSLR